MDGQEQVPTSASSGLSTPSNSFDSKRSIPFFSYKGRIGRLKLFLWSLLLHAIFAAIFLFFLAPGLPVVIIALVLKGAHQSGMPSAWPLYLLFLIPVVGILYLTMLSNLVVKRFHDLNKSGVYFLTLLVPLVNVYFALSLLLQCGTDGTNNYGDDPLPPGSDHGGFLHKIGKSFIGKTILIIALILFQAATRIP